MVPKIFSDDITYWRKWREEVAKYFDEEKEGMKAVMDDVAKQTMPITKEEMEDACKRNPSAIGEQLKKWKHLYRALEKLTEGEAAKVVSAVREENGFEAWRQLHLRFEPELEVQRNVVLLELHNIPAATTIEDAKAKLVELKVRIAKAEDILGEPIQEMQKKTALLQGIDLETKRHTATLKDNNFQQYYTAVMNFTNNASMGGRTQTTLNSVGKKEKEPEARSGEAEWLNRFNQEDLCPTWKRKG